MKIKKIKLENIRSYEQKEIEFPEGSTLLSGDIGSGKTSILLGIEFALFGLQPGQRGNSLLRNGSEKGSVVMEFEIEDLDIIVERTLKRGKTVSQDYCAITINGDKKEISVTELKSKVLELLNYPMEFAKKQNLLYRFTVYTPQEEMKEIILQDPDTRINTLRHIFGIDRYKKVIENSSLVLSKIREERRLREGAIGNLEQERLELFTKEDELESKRHNLSAMEKELFVKSDMRKRIQEEKEEITKKVEEKRKFNQEIEKSKIMISGKNDSISNNRKRIEIIHTQIEELEKIRFNPKRILELEQEIESNKREKERLNEKNIEIRSEISSLTYKIDENRKLEQKMSNLQICPTCLQNVESVYRANVLNKAHSESAENARRIEELEIEKIKLFQKIKEVEASMSVKDKEFSDLRIIKMKLEGIQEKKNNILDIERLNQALEKDIEMLRSHMDSLNLSVLELAKYDEIFEEKQRELEQAQAEEKSAEIRAAELRREIEVFSRQVEDLINRIKKLDDIKKRLDYLNELEDWFSKHFSLLVSLIEKNVMTKLKTEFSKSFSEWFSMLVSDSFYVRLSDDFTPIIEHQDYELDYSYLSGGERTAIALAYRLSLNQVINSFLSTIKTRDIVILDEPTDGFSEQQLDKMRGVLEELNVKQLIIVSHEQKIESFVDNIIKIKKDHGVSGVVE